MSLPELEAQLLAVATERLAVRPYALAEFTRHLRENKIHWSMTGLLRLAATDLAWTADPVYKRNKLVAFVDAWMKGAKLVEPLVLGCGINTVTAESSPVKETGVSPKRKNGMERAILQSFLDAGVGDGIAAIWVHIQGNAGKPTFPFSGCSDTEAVHINGRKLTRKNMERTLGRMRKDKNKQSTI